MGDLRDRYDNWRSATPSWIIACLGGLIVGAAVGSLLGFMTGSLPVGAVFGILSGGGWAALSWHR
jgi:hypothetical protein